VTVGLSHKVLVLLMNVHRAIKRLGPSYDAAIEVRVRDGNCLDAPKAVQLLCNLRLQDIDAVPQYVTRACRQSHHNSAWMHPPVWLTQHLGSVTGQQ